jgi:hypothetical protein
MLEPKLLLDRGADVEARNANGGSLLHSASSGGVTDLVELALRLGADIDAVNRYGLTPLHLAAMEGRSETVEFLLERGAAVGARDPAGRTPLFLAMAHSQEEVIRILESRGPTSNLLGTTPLTGEYLGQARPGTEPTLFALGVISTVHWEHSTPQFAPDGTEVYWSSIADFKRPTICYMRLDGDRWTVPRVASFTTEVDHFYPRFSFDGRRLYFSARRPAAGGSNDGGINIWYVERSNSGWSEPQPVRLPAGLGDVHGFSLDRDGTLYFTHSSGASFDIYRSSLENGEYTATQRLGDAINSEHPEDGPFIAADGSYLLFESIRREGYGGKDLYVSFRGSDGNWSTAMNVGPAVNTEAAERFPYVTPDGNYLFFGSNRNGNRGDVYWVGAEIIHRLRSRAGAER